MLPALRLNRPRHLALPALASLRPTLRLWVAGLAVAVVVLMAVLVSEVVANRLRRTAADAAVHNVETIVRGYVDPQIQARDLDLVAPLNQSISAALDRITVSGDIREVSIWSRDGRIVYSTEAALEGRRFSVGEMLATAFAGASVSAYDGAGTVGGPAPGPAAGGLEIFVPIRGRTDGNPIGVYKVTQDAHPIEMQVAVTRSDVFVIALAAASTLLLVLIGAFAGASARLTRQNRLLRERARRERLLAQDVRRNEERFRSLVRNSSDVILICDAEGTISYESPAVERVLGYDPRERVGQSAFATIHQADLEWTRAMLAELAHKPGAEVAAEYRVRHSDGSWRWLQGTAKNLLDDPAVGGIVVNYRDITERRSLEEQLRFQAFHDTLTELPNRALFMDRLNHALVRSRRGASPLAVLFLDLDDFKAVNDSQGHGAGDELLIGVAQRLRVVLREVDTAARMGGDEFAVLLEDTDDADGPVEVGSRVLTALRDPFSVQGRSVRMTGSIGIAVYAGPGQAAEELLRHADVAMYAAKNEGKDRLTVYEPDLHHATIDRHELKAELHNAFERGQFTLVYQPLLQLGSDQITGVEALLRWRHPLRGVIEPSVFVPLAEENGLIVALGRWVLVEACRQAKVLSAAAGRPIEMCVNVSSRQIADELLVIDVAEALEGAALDPRLLTLEITESILLEDIEVVVERLTALKRLGVRLAIDDFGTGYSSLSYLRRLPVDVLKIDRSFISAVDSGVAEGALVRSIVSIAQILELRTVAEGIEQIGQLEALRIIGVDEGQGFLFARPLEPEALPELLNRPRGKPARSRPGRSTARPRRLAPPATASLS